MDYEDSGPPIIIAQWGGRCPACGERYEEGDAIAPMEGLQFCDGGGRVWADGWGCADCS